MIRAVVAIALLALAGCGSTPETVYVHKVQRVEVPIPVPCVDEVPAEPVYATEGLDKSSSDGEVIRALAVEIEERRIAEGALRAALEGCKG